MTPPPGSGRGLSLRTQADAERRELGSIEPTGPWTGISRGQALANWSEDRSMNATITYRLSSAGQKASILSGGNGKNEQTITVERDHPEFARVLARATVNPTGRLC